MGLDIIASFHNDYSSVEDFEQKTGIQFGMTTVAEVRKTGGDVVRTTGRSPYHETLTGLMPEQVSKLLTPTVTNPGKKQRR